jgi:hypothetical protein
MARFRKNATSVNYIGTPRVNLELARLRTTSEAASVSWLESSRPQPTGDAQSQRETPGVSRRESPRLTPAQRTDGFEAGSSGQLTLAASGR